MEDTEAHGGIFIARRYSGETSGLTWQTLLSCRMSASWKKA